MEPSLYPSTGASTLQQRCSTCKKVLESTYYKNCSPCREKTRLKFQLAKKRKRDSQVAHLMGRYRIDLGLDSDGIVDENPRRDENRGVDAVVANTISTIKAGTKRKASKALRNLEDEEQRITMGVMKNGLKQAVKGNKRVVTPMRITSTAGEGKEYQTATALYESLKKKVVKSSANTDASKCLQFRGFHSIVAIGTIDNQSRVEMVAKDLRKIARVPFDHHNPAKTYNFETMGRNAVYTCTCLGNEVVPGPVLPVTKKTTMKGTQGNLIRQARLARALEASAITAPHICGGKVKITAVDDGRHPLGILGQRISISIEHPGATTKPKHI